MAILVHFLLLLFALCVGVPVKPRSPRGVDDIDCYGTECSYNYSDDAVEVNFPANLTEAIMFALPNIQGIQTKMVSLMNKTLILQEQENIVDKLGNSQMVSLMNKTLISQESVVDKLGNHLENIALSRNETLKSQHLIETRLENVEEILENIALSHNETLKSQHVIETRFENVEEVLENMTKLMSKLVENELLHNLVNGIHSIPAGDCSDLVARGIVESGSYVITPQDGAGSLKVYCDININIEGWTVLQKRYDGSVDFYRNWEEYENGFGDSNGEYWLGLKNIRRLISDGNTWALRIDLETFDGEFAYASYDSFSISDAESNYILSVGEYSGTAGDSLKMTVQGGFKMHNGMQFSTFDRDNDHAGGGSCASHYKGAFWYNGCHRANLNGKYLGRAGTDDWEGMIWYTWKQKQSLKTSQMKIRRVL